MLSLSPAVRIFVCAQPTDMRKSFDTLAALAHKVVQQSTTTGHLFLFRSRRGDRIKILWWSSGGYSLYYRRLEKGVFRLPEASAGQASVEIDAGNLAMILEGIDWTKAERRERYVPRKPAGDSSAAAAVAGAS